LVFSSVTAVDPTEDGIRIMAIGIGEASSHQNRNSHGIKIVATDSSIRIDPTLFARPHYEMLIPSKRNNRR